MRISIYLVFIITAFYWSCRNEDRLGTTKAEKEVEIPVHSAQEVRFSEIFDSVEYIPLRSGYFNELRKIQIKDDRIYISSTTPAALWRYDMKGYLVDSLLRQGEGPGEYSNIRDFNILANGDIYVLSRTEKKILIYDNHFQPINQFTIPVYATAFEVLTDNRVMLYCVNENVLTGDQVIVYDWGNDEILRGFFPMDQEQRTFINVIDRKNFIRYNNSLYFTRGFDNTIYQYKNYSMIPWLSVNFGNATLPQEYLDAEYANVMDFYDVIRSTDFAFRIIGWTIVSNYALFDFEKSNRFFLALLKMDLSTSRVFTVLEDDMVFKGAEFDEIVNIGPYTVDSAGAVYFFIDDGIIDRSIENENKNHVPKNGFTGSYVMRCILRKEIE